MCVLHCTASCVRVHYTCTNYRSKYQLMHMVRGEIIYVYIICSKCLRLDFWGDKLGWEEGGGGEREGRDSATGIGARRRSLLFAVPFFFCWYWSVKMLELPRRLGRVWQSSAYTAYSTAQLLVYKRMSDLAMSEWWECQIRHDRVRAASGSLGLTLTTASCTWSWQTVRVCRTCNKFLIPTSTLQRLDKILNVITNTRKTDRWACTATLSVIHVRISWCVLLTSRRIPNYCTLKRDC